MVLRDYSKRIQERLEFILHFENHFAFNEFSNTFTKKETSVFSCFDMVNIFMYFKSSIKIVFVNYRGRDLINIKSEILHATIEHTNEQNS